MRKRCGGRGERALTLGAARFDFLNLFEKTAALLDRDETLMCISSWNDNSRTHLGVDAQLLMRTSYFPGLGWMLKVTGAVGEGEKKCVPLNFFRVAEIALDVVA